MQAVLNNVLRSNSSTSINIDGKDYLYFGGTNYLGLAHRVELLHAAGKAFASFGWSAGASRLTSGENVFLLELESALASFGQAEAAVVLPAGFMANQAVVEGLDSHVAVWVASSAAHSSIHAALKHAHGKLVIVESQSEINLDLIRRHYKIGLAEPIAVFAEPIEAFDGKLADVPQILASLGDGDYLILDEAQSFGVLGEQGRGALEHFNLASRGARLLRSGTFSKAVGTYGGFVMAADELIFEIKENASCLRGSTSLPPLLCAATREALRLMQDDRAGTIKRLKSNINYLNQLLLDAEIISVQAQVPIFYLPFNKTVLRLRQTLVEKGVYFPPMSSYFAGADEVGLRWTIQAGHSKTELRRLVEILSVYA